jgi:hypothetical protein
MRARINLWAKLTVFFTGLVWNLGSTSFKTTCFPSDTWHSSPSTWCDKSLARWIVGDPFSALCFQPRVQFPICQAGGSRACERCANSQIVEHKLLDRYHKIIIKKKTSLSEIKEEWSRLFQFRLKACFLD